MAISLSWVFFSSLLFFFWHPGNHWLTWNSQEKEETKSTFSIVFWAGRSDWTGDRGRELSFSNFPSGILQRWGDQVRLKKNIFKPDVEINSEVSLRGFYLCGRENGVVRGGHRGWGKFWWGWGWGNRMSDQEIGRGSGEDWNTKEEMFGLGKVKGEKFSLCWVSGPITNLFWDFSLW